MTHKRRPRPARIQMTETQHCPNSIRYYRACFKMSLGTVSKIIGCFPQNLFRAETTGAGLHRRYWTKLCELFGCTAQDLEKPHDVTMTKKFCYRLKRGIKPGHKRLERN